MEHPLTSLERDLAALSDAWSGAMPASGAMAGGTQAEVEQMSDAGLVRVTDQLARLRREVDALLTRAAAEVARRSGPEFGDLGLAKAQGFHSPVRLIAASTGGSRGDAAKLIAVGSATAERATFLGERAPSRHPHVGAALESAAISLEAASAITGMLDRVALRAERAMADATEAALVRLAMQVPLEVVIRGVREAEARLDADGVEPREEQLRTERSLTIREDRNGMVHLHARLDPVTAAPVKAAVEALVSDVLRRRSDADSGDDGNAPPIRDDRSIPQLQADALADLARHALGCAGGLPPLASTTVVVRMDLETLVTGLGHARIDGIDQPISAASARRMAAVAELIPAVLGGDSLPLDLGRAARLFTRAQRLALGERDGGCASCGQNIGYVEAHHIAWWERDDGPTDLEKWRTLVQFLPSLGASRRLGRPRHRRQGVVHPAAAYRSGASSGLGGRARFEVSLTTAAA
ncbi:DUF222 domain-containing protein [Agromyces bauzanensis]